MKNILLIYMGGTIGMKENPKTGALAPVDFEEMQSEVPELERLKVNLTALTFSPIIDSSNVTFECWERLATLIEEHYDNYDGFVVLHGTDTMSFTASALSFMLENLGKPIVFTGSQIPIGVLRTDAKENLISAIEVAAGGVVNEVAIFFQDKLLRANRTTKHNSEYFDAFKSHNCSALAEAGITIHYKKSLLLPPPTEALRVHKKLCPHIATIRVYPELNPQLIDAVMGIPKLRAIILQTYGAGNAPTSPWLLEKLEKAVKSGILILNVTQCAAGAVNMNLYDTGKKLKNIGIIGGSDITFESAYTKLAHLLAQEQYNENQVKEMLKMAIRAEITV